MGEEDADRESKQQNYIVVKDYSICELAQILHFLSQSHDIVIDIKRCVILTFGLKDRVLFTISQPTLKAE